MSTASTATKMTRAEVLEEIQAVPYGQAPGDLSPGGALNRTASDDYVRCFVRNWSANIERDFVFESVSQYQGGEKSRALAMAKGEDFNLQELRDAHRNGHNADIIHRGIKPVAAIDLKFDSKYFRVPASKDPKKDPEWVPIPQGVMDLYYGNADRLASSDKREANDELERVRSFRKYDPCIRRNARGENMNKFGFLEFKREIIEPSVVAVDTDSIFTDDYIEV